MSSDMSTRREINYVETWVTGGNLAEQSRELPCYMRRRRGWTAARPDKPEAY